MSLPCAVLLPSTSSEGRSALFERLLTSLFAVLLSESATVRCVEAILASTSEQTESVLPLGGPARASEPDCCCCLSPISSTLLFRPARVGAPLALPREVGTATMLLLRRDCFVVAFHGLWWINCLLRAFFRVSASSDRLFLVMLGPVVLDVPVDFSCKGSTRSSSRRAVRRCCSSSSDAKSSSEDDSYKMLSSEILDTSCSIASAGVMIVFLNHSLRTARLTRINLVASSMPKLYFFMASKI